MAVEEFLLKLCDYVHFAERSARDEKKREMFGDQFFPELLLMKEDKVRVEIRKEDANHKAPHIHVTHSDKIDVSISLIDFSILAGKIDNKTKKHLLTIFIPIQKELNEIWRELNEKDNSVGAEKLINNLGLCKK